VENDTNQMMKSYLLWRTILRAREKHS